MAETVEKLLAEGRRLLAAAPSAPSRREAALLLGWALGLTEAQVLARGREVAPAGAAERFRGLLGRRLAGEPVAYLTGEREFYGRPFAVDRRVLIPRPETEHLVEAALAQDLPAEPRILDLGTGSGCVAVTLALEQAAARVVATDRSPAALAVAAANVRRHRVGGRVLLAAGDLTASLRLERFDLVVSNPPYVDRREAPRLPPDVRDFEPAGALFADRGGLGVLARILTAGAAARPGAVLLCEIGDGQLPAVVDLVESLPLDLVETRRDYAGKDRVVALRRLG